MKPRHVNAAERDQERFKCDTALRKLSNFCSSYQPEQIDDLSSKLLSTIISEKYSVQDARTKERLLDFLEAVEEILPALHDLHRHISSVEKPGTVKGSYEQEIGYRELFAALRY